MRSALLVVVVALGCLTAGCAHRPLALVLSFAACPVTRAANGQDVDDAGVDVAANVSTDLAPETRALAHEHFPGSCAIETAPGGLPALACSDPHVDVRYFLAWTRPSPRTLVLERREVSLATASTRPTARRPLAELAVDRKVLISAPPPPTCPPP
jgi:hypothetical protein